MVDTECQRGLEQLKGLLSHFDPHMTLGQLVGRLVKEGLDRHDPARPPRRAQRPAGSHSAEAERTSAPERGAHTTADDATRNRPAIHAGTAASTAEPEASSACNGTSAPKPLRDTPAPPPKSSVMQPRAKSLPALLLRRRRRCETQRRGTVETRAFPAAGRHQLQAPPCGPSPPPPHRASVSARTCRRIVAVGSRLGNIRLVWKHGEQGEFRPARDPHRRVLSRREVYAREITGRHPGLAPALHRRDGTSPRPTMAIAAGAGAGSRGRALNRRGRLRHHR